jgi:O-antigen/teichoic acid export membrane protein
VVPLAIAVIAIPVVARALGPGRFGLLGLAWATVEYLGFFDLGLSRATVRFVADALARGARDLRQIVAVSVTIQVVLGGLAGLLVLTLAPLVIQLLSIPPELRSEALATFRVVGANVAIVLSMNGLRGVLEGAQRFDYAVALKIPAAAAATAVPAAGAVMGASIPEILWMVFAARLLILVGLLTVVPMAVTGFRWEGPREWHLLGTLFRFSGWLAVSAIANSVLVSFDRFALAALSGIAAVGFYTAPYEGAMRLLLIPHSIFAALFPALTTTETLGSRARTNQLMESALRQMTLLLGFAVVTVVVLAPELLRLWIGETFAAEAGLALRILVVGVLLNALAHPPLVFLYAAGRPDIPAKFHLLELVFHVPLTLLLIRGFGIAGAALAWTIRVTVDSAALMVASRRLGGWRLDVMARALWMRGLATLALFAGVLAVAALTYRRNLLLAAALLLVAVTASVWAVWSRALTSQERGAWLALLRYTPERQRVPH